MQAHGSEQRNHRLFVAIDLPRELCAEIESCLSEARAFWPEGYRWRFARSEQLHFTLKFLGTTASARLPEVESALAAVSQHTASFSVRLSRGLSQFRGAQGMRVAWIGTEPEPAFAALAARLGQALAPIGFEPEKRPYQAHLTLARGRPTCRAAGTPDFRALEKALDARHPLLGAPWQAREIVLYESFTNPEGAHYLERKRFPLAAGQAQSNERKSR